MKKSNLKLFCLSLLAAIVVAGCATISPFDQYSYVQVTSAKVDVLNLMDRSNEAFADHQQEVAAVNSTLFKIIEYEKHRPKNQITVRMWEKMIRIDSAGTIDETTMIPSFWKKWKKDGKESRAFLEEAKGQVSRGFDLIAELEANKIKETDSKISTFLSNK